MIDNTQPIARGIFYNENTFLKNVGQPVEKAQFIILDQPRLEQPKNLKTKIIKILKNVLRKILKCFQECLKIQKVNQKEKLPIHPAAGIRKDQNNIPQQPNFIENPRQHPLAADDLYKEALNLMFEKKKLNWLHHEEAEPIGPFSEKELIQRHEDLKKIIMQIPADHINDGIQFRDGMSTRTTTLLLHAIMNIKNAERRFEIVKLLIEKGANIHQQGYLFDLVNHIVDPLEEIEKIKDRRLYCLYKNLNENDLSKQTVGEISDLLLPYQIEADRKLKEGLPKFDNYTKYMNFIKILNSLFKILPEHINLKTTYQEGNQVFEVPLLLQAILQYESTDDDVDDGRVLFIVDALLKSGADPHINGTYNGQYNSQLNVMEVAVKRGNVELIEMLKIAMKKRM